jgi:N-acetylmuramoyl-L-alanine amidase
MGAAMTLLLTQCGPSGTRVSQDTQSESRLKVALTDAWKPTLPRPARAVALMRSIAQRAVAARPALYGWTIVVDPGHGRDPRYGNYTGARGVNGVSEDQNVLDIGERLVSLLRAEGATVYITRGAYDPGPPPKQGLIQRVALAESVHANLFISIHQNDGSATDHGTQTWYYWSGSATLATDVQQAMIAGTGLVDAGIHQKGFYVVYRTSMPSVLVEGGFLSNPAEAALISTAAFHQREAQALDAGILRYAAASRPTSG